MAGIQHPSGALITLDTATVGTISSVASTNASTTLLSEDKTRKRFTIYNSDANTLYVALSDVTADAATNFTVALASGNYFEFYGYTGIVKGIWSADGVGYAVITSFK
jgi:hypothetical protein